MKLVKITATVTEELVIKKKVAFLIHEEEVEDLDNLDPEQIEEWILDDAYERTIYDPDHGWETDGDSHVAVDWSREEVIFPSSKA